MDFLRSLDTESDFGTMCKMLMTSSNVCGLHEMFEGYDPKVLLSSFMIKNFSDMFPDPMVHKAQSVSEIILENKLKSFEKDLKDFEKVFEVWKKKDLENLKDSITLKMFQMESLKVHEMDEADKQWNDGVDLSIKTMGEALDSLTPSTGTGE